MAKGGESVISSHVVYISRLEEMTEYFILCLESVRSGKGGLLESEILRTLRCAFL